MAGSKQIKKIQLIDDNDEIVPIGFPKMVTRILEGISDIESGKLMTTKWITNNIGVSSIKDFSNHKILKPYRVKIYNSGKSVYWGSKDDINAFKEQCKNDGIRFE